MLEIWVILQYPFLGSTVPISRQPVIPGYQNIIFDDFILTLCNFNITYDNSFVTFNGSLIFFLSFDCFILTLCNSNVTFDNSFITFDGSLFFSSHLIVSSSHYVVPTSYVTVLLSHLMVSLFFLTFDSFILTLCNSNIICDSSFVKFGGFLVFSHI